MSHIKETRKAEEAGWMCTHCKRMFTADAIDDAYEEMAKAHEENGYLIDNCIPHVVNHEMVCNCFRQGVIQHYNHMNPPEWAT